MATNPVVTPAASADLLEIWCFIAEDSIPAADRVLESIEHACSAVAEMPGIGRSREELAATLRSVTCGSYLIFYRSKAAGVEVVRVLHGARDLDTIFGA